ncbi:MAG: hypothetical protein ABIA21_03385 [Candidatus Aenigmatarchaeota archaeon]
MRSNKKVMYHPGGVNSGFDGFQTWRPNSGGKISGIEFKSCSYSDNHGTIAVELLKEIYPEIFGESEILVKRDRVYDIVL